MTDYERKEFEQQKRLAEMQFRELYNPQNMPNIFQTPQSVQYNQNSSNPQSKQAKNFSNSETRKSSSLGFKNKTQNGRINNMPDKSGTENPNSSGGNKLNKTDFKENPLNVFGSLGLNSDTALLALLALLLYSENADRILILALIYIML